MKLKSLSLALAVVLSGPGLADTSSESAITLGSVTVSGGNEGAMPAVSILTSVDVLGGDQVEDKNVMNSWELIGLMPGVQLTEYRMGAESGKATFRAFNGEGYINGIKVLIDGIPSNVNSGNQRFIDMIFPLEIDFIEVVRGTNDPRYGLHNIGGNINIGTRLGGNYTDLRYTAGSFGSHELQAALGREANGWSQNYFFGKQISSGYRDHDRSDKYSLGGKWFYTTDDRSVRAGLSARLYAHEAEEPGYLTASELASDRSMSPDKNANDESFRHMQQLSAHLDWRLRDDLNLSNLVYYNRYDDDRRITFTPYPVGNAPRQRRQWDETQTGFSSTLTWRGSDRVSLEGGINMEHQRNSYLRTRFNYTVPTDFTATPARIQNDDEYTLTNQGAYLQAVVRPIDRLKLIPAIRVDRFRGHAELNQTGESGPLQDYGWIDQPKLSVVYSLTQDTHIYANWGKTFQILTGSRAPAYLIGAQEAYRPSINTGTELGIKFKPINGTEARVALWRQEATDEVANMPSTGTTVGLGQTLRRGVDLQITSRINAQWSVWLSHAYQEAKVRRAFTAAGQSLAGKEVFSTPRFITNVGVDYAPNASWRFGVQGRAQGNYFIDDLNEQGKYGGFALLDASARYAVSPSVSVDFQVKNLFDHEYEYVWYDNFFWGGNDQPMFSPGPGRAAYLSVNVKL